jgi:hypothetical protein
MLTLVQIQSLLFASLTELQQDAVGHFRHPSILGDDDVPVNLDYVAKDLPDFVRKSTLLLFHSILFVQGGALQNPFQPKAGC